MYIYDDKFAKGVWCIRGTQGHLFLETFQNRNRMVPGFLVETARYVTKFHLFIQIGKLYATSSLRNA